ncbi:MAG TPA: GerMN domain-containing protein, partial [Miltoncostaeales bacterium]|nr:GerMN domain-containing protein [Miltoncostaeales bacterium]
MDRTSSRARRIMVALAAAGLLAAIPATATATKVNIYLTRGAKLQMIERTLPTGADKLTYSVRTLFVGATKTERDDGVVSRIPKGTKLYSVVVRDRVAYVRVGTAFAASGTGSQIKVRFGQLVYTVLQYKQVDAVRVLLDDEVMPPADAIDSALLDHGSVPKLDIIPPLPVGVRAVQQSLAKLKYLPLGAVNGSLDYRTSQALLAFQGWEGLLRTGTPTVETRLRLTTARIPTPRRRTTARRMEVTR